MSTKLEPFRLEEFLATREFSSNYMFCASDIESRSIREVLDLLPKEKLNQFLDLSLAYTLPLGDIELIKEISALYDHITPENVLCFAGAEEAIYSAAKVFLNINDHAITITPCYQSLESVAKSVCEVSKVDVDLVHGEWSLDVEKIAQEIRANTKVLFINFPHNPTGYIPSKETFRSIMNLAEKHGIIVFSDEVYRGLELNPLDRLPSASDLYSNAISLGVMSKSYGFPGLRIGWITTQNKLLLDKLSKFKHYLSICNSAPSEWLSTEILRKSDYFLKTNNQLAKVNFKILKEYFLSQKKLFQWIDPNGGCIAYPKYIGKGNIFDVADHLLKSKGVVILPDWVYGQSNQHFRVSFGRKNCKEALKHFKDFFSENKQYECQ